MLQSARRVEARDVKLPSCLQRNRFGIYYFRRAVPEALRPTVGKLEIIRSLRTRELRRAIWHGRPSICSCRVIDSMRIVDSVKQDGRFTDSHFGRSTGMIVGSHSVMVVAPCS